MTTPIDMTWPDPDNPAAHLTQLPLGDITFDGEHLSVDGRQLAPGDYRIGEQGPVLHVAELPDDEY